MEQEKENKMTDQEKEIKKIKKKYNLSEVYVLEIPADEEGNDIAVGYIKKPNRHVMGLVMGRMAGQEVGVAYELLMNSCLLKEESDPRILTDDDIFWGGFGIVKDLLKIRKAEIKKF